ncbi:hypothetical protein [Phytohabitans rumicis]|uniref:Uncharacterized protein n=1 Tax=Phytohabitans rumicis TaxID=1076125 RepID=A0A6V8L498_9ACTN|nr:hypothetical protein [Phytohabitans rumicis]GFJ88887.1 hypothetical protein Prum_025290 [Phytohabitans rumicis]
MQVPYADLHEMLDRLTPEQAEAIRGVMRQFAAAGRPGQERGEDLPRRLSFVGQVTDGPSDLAERSEEIIRARFNDAA